MKSKLKLILVCAIFFVFGYMVQSSVVKVSNFEKIANAITCSNSNPETSLEFLSCYVKLQSSTPGTIFNSLNPSNGIANEMIRQMSQAVEKTLLLEKCVNEPKTIDQFF